MNTTPNPLRPIQIGPITLADPVILAPMSGVSDLPFRRLVKKIGAGLVVSEMIASQAMIRETRQAMMMAQNGPDEFPTSVQLAGCEPAVMAEAAKLVQDLGANIIDINFGCPAKKVVNGYAGSHLMRDEILAGQIMAATVQAVSVPVTMKMRMGWDEQSLNAPRLAKIAEDAGIQMLTVHGRTRCQFYTGQADWPFIQQVKAATKLPVIANGDIADFADVDNALRLSGADGVMIGRGSYGRPWFIRQVMHYRRTGEILPSPSLVEQYDIIRGHYDAMLSHYGTDTGLKIARKHLGWYSKGLPDACDFRAKVNTTPNAAEVFALMDAFFQNHLSRDVPMLVGQAA